MKKKELIALLQDPEVEAALGNIIMKAVNQALERDIKLELGSENPGGPPVVVERRRNILDHLCYYLPRVEGALRGAQADTNRTFNAVGRIANSLGSFTGQIGTVLKEATRKIAAPAEVIEGGDSQKSH